MNDSALYLDHASTTPVRPEVRVAMEPFLSDRFGNPSSTHAPGRAARGALEEARERVAAALGADPSEIYFTGGGTEADNLAILGRWRADGRGVALSAVEHSAVRRAASQAAREGAAVTTLAVDETGHLDLGALDEALEEQPSVVSVMWANNEIGTLQPVEDAARRCRDQEIVFHTDAVQAIGHVPVSIAEVPCDLLALSAHKFGGPRGVGALFIRRGTTVDPLLHGGGQERGLRAGTANVAGAVGLAEALTLAVNGLGEEMRRLSSLRNALERRLTAALPAAVVNGGEPRVPHILSLSVNGLEPDLLLPALDMAGLAVSSGSACHSGATSPSHVMVALGQERDAVIRFSLGWSSTEPEVEVAGERFLAVVERLRSVAA